MGALSAVGFRLLIGHRLHRDASRPISKAMASRFDRTYNDVVKAGGGRIPRMAETYAAYDFLRHLLLTRPVALHGSTNPGLVEIQPLTVEYRNEVACSFAYASTTLLRVVQIAFCNRVLELFSDRKLSANPGCHPVMGGSYVVNHNPSDTYAFFSINSGLLDLDLGEITIYICPLVEMMKLPAARDGRVAKMTRGGINGWMQWVSSERVLPLARIGFRLEDIPFGYGWHRDGEPLFSVMWNFRARSRGLCSAAVRPTPCERTRSSQNQRVRG